MEGIAFALDIGSSKICALVGEINHDDLQIIGIGEQPAPGIRKGMITNVAHTAQAIARAVEEAEQTSGYKLTNAFVNISGEHIFSSNNVGAVAISNREDGVTMEDIHRAMDAARAIPIPHNREILHLLPRHFAIDDQEGVSSPIGMHGFRLEVDAHIITASTPAIQTLAKCSETVELKVDHLIMSALASADAILTEAEKDMGVLLVDIGAGTTDVTLYANGAPYFCQTLPIGGQLISNDISIGLRVPFEIGEQIKIKHGDCRPEQFSAGATFSVEPFGGEKIAVGHHDLAMVIEARVDEIFQMVSKAVKGSGFSGLLPAGIVITGGSAQLKGIADVASRALGIPARVALPTNLKGLVDKINSPAYATAVGMLRWAMNEHYIYEKPERSSRFLKSLYGFFRVLLPE